MRPRRLPRWIWAAVPVLVCGLLIAPAGAQSIIVTGAGEGGGPHLRVFDAATGAVLFEFLVYHPAFTGGVRVAAADVNGDGVPDVVTVAGPGGGPHVRVFDGAALLAGQLVELVGLMSYNPAFAGGVYIAAASGACPPNMVRSGPTCIDQYEASVWEVPPGNVALIQKIKAGTVTLAELLAGAFQRGATSDDYGAGCPDSGNGCKNFYAVSIPGVTPSRFLTWFQAAAAARNAGKRLPTNAEWQAAALGTPDGAPCNVGLGGAVTLTGTPGCVSDVGVFDMVGNLVERVADWVPMSTACPGWATMGTFSSDDAMCLAGASTTAGPGALLRGNDSSAARMPGSSQ